ncbi:MAG: 4Fe-4S binding protein [Anaerolineae bacterium]|nr:4Fe-4S binding protein [Anaerolineae bacterium]
MTHVITGLCLRHGGCVERCPVDCIRPGEPIDEWPTYYIDPEACTDCGLCIPACPYNAIWPEVQVPGWLKEDISRNRAYFAPRQRGVAQ